MTFQGIIIGSPFASSPTICSLILFVVFFVYTIQHSYPNYALTYNTHTLSGHDVYLNGYHSFSFFVIKRKTSIVSQTHSQEDQESRLKNICHTILIQDTSLT